ncbi:MAG TPA: UDP-N-acetylglucosamine 1-carboxyvinyltransferase [Candidatus Babeliaceae bacterium]|nr:UDP-N-acetylglucosamine 1-carboxyvinyltransferase [Candidatus Babeliaceae bacterium]
MVNNYLIIEQSRPLVGQGILAGAKNAVLVIMASLLLTRGSSRLHNVPNSDDVFQMIDLLKHLGVSVSFDSNSGVLDIDTSSLEHCVVHPDSMKRMRASILVLGPLLARYGYAKFVQPGGCVLGIRPIDFHLKAFIKMGIKLEQEGDLLLAQVDKLKPGKFVLEYPSVGATENILMAAVLTPGVTRIINAALEPEVFDLISVLRKMGACITLNHPATIEIEGVNELRPIDHEIMVDRLEAGTILLAVAVTKGSITIPQAPAYSMEVFLEKLNEMGHSVEIGAQGVGVSLRAAANPKAVSFKTMPYPGFPTDLQAPMMVAQCLASGVSVIHETVFENRLVHVRELQKMGANITTDGTTAYVKGVDELQGTQVVATDIRACAALLIAGLAARGKTVMSGIRHLRRGYQGLESKLRALGATIASE